MNAAPVEPGAAERRHRDAHHARAAQREPVAADVAQVQEFQRRTIDFERPAPDRERSADRAEVERSGAETSGPEPSGCFKFREKNSSIRR